MACSRLGALHRQWSRHPIFIPLSVHEGLSSPRTSSHVCSHTTLHLHLTTALPRPLVLDWHSPPTIWQLLTHHLRSFCTFLSHAGGHLTCNTAPCSVEGQCMTAPDAEPCSRWPETGFHSAATDSGYPIVPAHGQMTATSDATTSTKPQAQHNQTTTFRPLRTTAEAS